MTTRSRTKIALMGLFGIDNYGNEASLAAMLRHLRAACPDNDVELICTRPERVSKDYGLPAVSMRMPNPPRAPSLVMRLYSKVMRVRREISCWRRTIGYLRNVRLLIIPGTGALDDFGEPPFGVPYDLFRWCVAARIAGTRVKLVSIGAGPIKHPLSRWLMKTAARMADYRSYRDVISKDFMCSIGIDVSSDPVFPDLAFSLPVERRLRPRQVGGSRVVAVGVMTYYGWRNDPRLGDAIYEEYVEKITQFVRWLLAEGHSVRLIIGDRSDGPAAQRVVDAVTQEHIAALTAGRFVATPPASLDDVLKELTEADIVVATRFHNVVGAFMVDKPVISLGYAAKNDVLLGEMGMGKFCQHIERFELEQLIAHFREVSGRQLELEQQVRSRRLEYERRLSQQFADILPPERKQPIGAGIVVS